MQPAIPRIDFYTAADGRRLAARVWEAVHGAGSKEQGANTSGPPPAALCPPPRARIVFLHGITSHGGWYNRSCRHLASAGYEVHFLDRRGSGLNPQDRGDVDRWDTWMSDVEVYLEQIGREQGAGSTENALPPAPCPPLILAGISWGGKLAVAVARHRPDLMQGLALICPGLYAYQQAGWLGRMFLSCPLPPRIAGRHVTIPLTDPWLFTGTPPWVSFVAEDPLSLREVTIRFAREDLKLTHYAREATTFPTLDVLLVLSGRDRIIDNAPTRAYFARVEAKSKRLIEYAGAGHTLEFEPDPEQYLSDVTEWVEQVSSEERGSRIENRTRNV